MEESPIITLSAIAKVRRELKKPPKTAEEYIKVIKKQSLPVTAELLKNYIEYV